MTKREAELYLIEMVVDYLGTGLPLAHLTGEGVGGKPDEYHLNKLKKALTTLGYDREVKMMESN